MVNGRRKGNAAELEVCAKVQEWWQELPLIEQDTPDGNASKFIRTPQSGGWSTRQVRGNFRVAGDLSSTSESWPFTVEVKRRENWTLSMFVKAGKRGSPVWSWWAQCVKAAKEEGGVPMMWMRRSRQPWIVLMPDSVLSRVVGVPNLDIYWENPAQVSKHNLCPVHPAGLLADKLLCTRPELWLGLRGAFGTVGG